MPTPAMPADLVASGLTFPELRDLMRDLMRPMYFDVDDVEVGLDRASGEVITDEAFIWLLLDGGYARPSKYRSDTVGVYEMTMKGRQIGMKSLRRYTLKAVTDAKTRLFAGVDAMEADPEFEFQIDQIAIFGSVAWPEGKADFGDLDIAYSFKEKERFAAYAEAVQAMRERLKGTKMYGLEQTYGPEPYDRVRRYLKEFAKASSILSLTDLSSLRSYGFEHRIVYDLRKGGWLKAPEDVARKCADQAPPAAVG